MCNVEFELSSFCLNLYLLFVLFIFSSKRLIAVIMKIHLHITSLATIVAVATAPPIPRDGGSARTAVQVHAVNLIVIRPEERWQPISN